jgi:integrase
VLTEERAGFFRQHSACRAGDKLMFSHADGSPWKSRSSPGRCARSCEHARITPAVGFHTLRHTWASLAVMARVPLLVVATAAAPGASARLKAPDSRP